MKAMLLTAGLGTRLRPITDFFAKPAIPFLGVPLASFARPILESAGAKSFVMNKHYLPEQIEALAQKWQASGAPTVTSDELAAPLGAGGGVWKARALLEGGGDFLVANGDEVILPHDPAVMTKFMAQHRQMKNLVSILVMENPLVGTQFGGVWCDSNMNVRGFGKDGSVFGAGRAGVRGYHYIGILALSDRIFEFLPEGESNILYDAVAAAIAKGERVVAYCDSFTWYETGNPHDFLGAIGHAIQLLGRDSADAVWLKKVLARFQAPGWKLEKRDGATVFMAPDAHLDAAATLSGFIVLESGAHIEKGAHAENVVVFPGARIRAGEARKNEIVLP